MSSSSPLHTLSMLTTQISDSDTKERRRTWEHITKTLDTLPSLEAHTQNNILSSLEDAFHNAQWRPSDRTAPWETWLDIAQHTTAPLSWSLVRSLRADRRELTPDDLQKHLHHPQHLRHITHLNLYDSDLDTSAIAFLGTTIPRDLPNLTSLNLGFCDLSTQAAHNLLSSDLNLTELTLSKNTLTDALSTLPSPTLLQPFHTLRLSHTDLTDEDIHALSSLQLPNLTSLSLRGAPLNPSLWNALALAPFPALRHLDISDSTGPDYIDEPSVEAFIQSPTLPSLQTLTIYPPRIWGSSATVQIGDFRTPNTPS